MEKPSASPVRAWTDILKEQYRDATCHIMYRTPPLSSEVVSRVVAPPSPKPTSLSLEHSVVSFRQCALGTSTQENRPVSYSSAFAREVNKTRQRRCSRPFLMLTYPPG